MKKLSGNAFVGFVTIDPDTTDKLKLSKKISVTKSITLTKWGNCSNAIGGFSCQTIDSFTIQPNEFMIYKGSTSISMGNSGYSNPVWIFEKNNHVGYISQESQLSDYFIFN